MVLKNGEKVAVRLITFTDKDAVQLLRYARIGRVAVITTGVYYGMKIVDAVLKSVWELKHRNSTEQNSEEEES